MPRRCLLCHLVQHVTAASTFRSDKCTRNKTEWCRYDWTVKIFWSYHKKKIAMTTSDDMHLNAAGSAVKLTSGRNSRITHPKLPFTKYWGVITRYQQSSAQPHVDEGTNALQCTASGICTCCAVCLNQISVYCTCSARLPCKERQAMVYSVRVFF